MKNIIIFLFCFQIFYCLEKKNIIFLFINFYELLMINKKILYYKDMDI